MDTQTVAFPIKGPFTVSICTSDHNVASQWVPLISVAPFTLSETKHQRETLLTQMQSLTVNGPCG